MFNLVTIKKIVKSKKSSPAVKLYLVQHCCASVCYLPEIEKWEEALVLLLESLLSDWRVFFETGTQRTSHTWLSFPSSFVWFARLINGTWVCRKNRLKNYLYIQSLEHLFGIEGIFAWVEWILLCLLRVNIFHEVILTCSGGLLSSPVSTLTYKKEQSDENSGVWEMLSKRIFHIKSWIQCKFQSISAPHFFLFAFNRRNLFLCCQNWGQRIQFHFYSQNRTGTRLVWCCFFSCCCVILCGHQESAVSLQVQFIYTAKKKKFETVSVMVWKVAQRGCCQFRRKQLLAGKYHKVQWSD